MMTARTPDEWYRPRHPPVHRGGRTRADAMPSEEEITRIRQLISRIKATLDDLAPQERAAIDQAVAAVRRHRAISLGMPRIRQPPPGAISGRTA